MRRSPIIVMCALATGIALGGDSVSSAFTFDARYKASGLTPESWVAYQAEGLSGRFATRTVVRAIDANGNGIPDAWEQLYGLAGDDARAEADPDNDGRTNIQEYNAGTNPVLIDDWTKSVAETSEAFVTDTRVYYTGGNPTFDVAFAVIRVSNAFICDTGGLYYDWDNDGIPNWWEARYSRNGKTGLVAGDDDDHDGLSNYGEFVAYTDPTNSTSKFVIGLAPITVVPVTQAKSPLLVSASASLAAVNETTASSFALQWQSVKGRTYAVYMKNDLSEDWPDEPIVELNGTGDVLEYVPGGSAASMFFKVSVRLSDDY